MILLSHIAIALASVAFTTYLFFSPSKAKIRTAVALVALTLISGTYLVVSTNANLVQACGTGLIYVGAVSCGIILARNKLANAEK